MKNRIRFISHKGKKILLVDCTNCSAEELVELAALVPAQVTPQPRLGAAAGGFYRRGVRSRRAWMRLSLRWSSIVRI